MTIDTPFQPLTSQLTEQPPQGNDNPLPPLLYDNNEYTPSQAYQQKLGQQQQDNRTPNAPKGFGTMAHIIAILAATKGNYGPAFAIHEAGRKAEAYQFIKPHVLRANTLTNKGDYVGAQKILNELLTQVGDKSPELSTFIQGAIDKVDKKDITHQNLKTANVAMEQMINTGVFKDNPKDDPRYPMLTVMKELERNHSPLSDELRKAYGDSLKLDITATRDTTRSISPYSGKVAVAPTQRITEGEDVNTYVQQRIIEANPGLLPRQIITALNGISTLYKTPDGKQIDISQPPYVDKLKENVSKYSGEFAALERAKLVPLEPRLTSLALAKGADPVGLSTRTGLGPTGALQGGKAGKGTLEQAEDDQVTRQQRLAESSIRASQDVDVYAGSKANLVPVYIDKDNRQTFLTIPQTRLSATDVRKAGNLREIDKDTYSKVVIPLYQAFEGLQYVDQMFKELDNPNDTLSRLSTGISRKISEYTGIYDTGTALSTVARAAVERAVEEMEGTKEYNDKSIANLKAALSGGFTSSKVGREVAKRTADRISQRLGIHIGRDNVPNFSDDISAVTGVQKEGAVQQSSAPTYPTQQQLEGAGLVPGIPAGPAQQKPTKRYIRRER